MQQPDLFAEPLVEPLAAYVARRTGCNMKFLTNQITLARWVERLGEDHVRKRLESTAHPYPRGKGSGDPRFLRANWEWIVMAPAAEVFAFAF